MGKISDVLLEWYAQNGRELPWRKSKDAYHIWVSEIILQQTRVSQGYDYYMRFIERFPTVGDLALADEEEVLVYWQGLGYYSRARNLHAASRQVVAMGGMPRTYEGVRSLKGVGDYTAAAICSIAYGLPYAVVDGNVYRVISRLKGITTPIDTSLGKREFALLANELMDKQSPGEYNQAIMDFGALQCLPQSPLCESCPLAEVCVAYISGSVSHLPVKQHRTKTKTRFFNYIYVRAGGYTYISKRSADDIWRNLYELPLIETEEEVGEEEFYTLPQLNQLVGTEKEVIQFRLLRRGVKHVLSHRIIYANFYEAIVPEDTKAFSSCLKIHEDELDKYPVSRLVSLFLEKKQS